MVLMFDTSYLGVTQEIYASFIVGTITSSLLVSESFLGGSIHNPYNVHMPKELFGDWLCFLLFKIIYIWLSCCNVYASQTILFHSFLKAAFMCLMSCILQFTCSLKLLFGIITSGLYCEGVTISYISGSNSGSC